MKIILRFFLLVAIVVTISSTFDCNAQNVFPYTGSVGIGTTAPAASSILELKSTKKGFLIPRMTSAQRTAILSPTIGLLIYQLDGLAGVYYYQGSWKYLNPSNANPALSNLTRTAINQSLIPASIGSLDLGSSTKSWKNLFLSGTATTNYLKTNNLNIQNGAFSLEKASDNPWDRPIFLIERARGTRQLPATVVNGDMIGSILVSAYEGHKLLENTSIDFWVDSVTTAGNIPTSMTFTTGSNPVNRKIRLRVGSNGNFNFNNNQLFIEQATGRLSIGTTSPSNSKLTIENPYQGIGLSVYNNNYSNPINKIGIWVSSIGNNGNGIGGYFTGGTYGITSYGQSFYTDPDGSEYGVGLLGAGFVNNDIKSSGTSIGVKGLGAGGNTNYGVYGYTNDIWGDAFNAAGYFSGDVHAINYFSISDRKFKTDIKPLTGSLNKLLNLKPSSYSYRKSDNLKRMGVPSGKQLGLIADEVKQIFPELVKDAVEPAYYDTARIKVSSPEKYESINYLGLIPVLVASIKEQQVQIEKLNNELQELKSTVRAQTKQENEHQMQIELGPSIGQNIPNPSKASTSIAYYIPRNVKTAEILILDTQGRAVKTYRALRGSGHIMVRNGDVASGNYNYTLIVDGKMIDTKQMILIK